ncbi:hypothetical protein BKH43_04325 [Helicobacter sp. 13S00401-1]|uniref:outer membrane beta-barrel protein n=1 Tax=Helicobacter sp. 13S00401-1 TaxID=1905758 RepID=UPI000BA50721|nr:outer membrane beta-barrel protein [Helicobacter sp. 13S00401-1]PAF50788.1 hypothetical protein BKH43_04325 [Helicobacter sp. 13S00401-1]
MKKKVLLGAACLALALSSASYAKSGVFVGANVGLPITTPTYVGEFQNAEASLPNTGVGYVLGLDAGYQQNFTPKMGLRYYLSYNFSQSFASKTSEANDISQKLSAVNFNHLIAANVDFFYNITDMFGAYAGLGAGFTNFSTDMTGTVSGDTPDGQSQTATVKFVGNSFALPLNLGVSMNLGDHQVIKLGAKIPLVGTDIKDLDSTDETFGNGTFATLRNYIIQVGYSYIF